MPSPLKSPDIGRYSAAGGVPKFSPLVMYMTAPENDPTLPPVFAAHLKSVIPAGVTVMEFDCHINDEPFADAIIGQVLEYGRARTESR